MTVASVIVSERRRALERSAEAGGVETVLVSVGRFVRWWWLGRDRVRSRWSAVVLR